MVALLDLDADLLAHIARRGGAPVLCAMARTSHELRAPLVAAGDALWRDSALARFPCLKSLLELVPTSLPFRSLYRKQLAAVSPQSEASFPDLSSYVFSVELAVPAIGWSAAWSAEASSFTVEHGNGHVYSGWDKICNPQPWTDATRPEWLTKTLAVMEEHTEDRPRPPHRGGGTYRQLDNYAFLNSEDAKSLTTMSLSIIATRRVDLRAFRMFEFTGRGAHFDATCRYASVIGMRISDNTVDFDAEPLPEKEGLINFHSFDHQGCFPRLEIEPSFDLETGHIHLGLGVSGYDRWDSFDVVQAKKYFANCAPWAEVPVD